MSNAGYYRCPTIHGDIVVFVCEDDLWSVSTGGGAARRLTSGHGECSLPRFSPDGTLLAFVGRDEWHPELYVMPSAGGTAARLTFLGAEVFLLSGFTHDGSDVLFTSDSGSPFLRNTQAFAVNAGGGPARNLNLGHVASIASGARGRTVLCRNAVDQSRWKRYRGGTAGDLWIDGKGSGEFRRLISVDGNATWPMLAGDRVYFVSDHEGVGNLYSCSLEGADLRRHTDFVDYFVRYPSTDGKRIVFTAGARIYCFDCGAQALRAIDVDAPSSPPQLVRRFVEAASFLEHFAPHPSGHSLALIARGQPFTMPNWEDGVVHHGVGSKVRYRLSEWLHDGERFAGVDDAQGRERIRIYHADQSKPPQDVTDADIGRVIELAVSPAADIIAVANHRHELLLIDAGTGAMRAVDRSPYARIGDLAFSPDGRWLAYSWAPSSDSAIIRIADVESSEVHDVTEPLRVDRAPAFDPEGKYLYFLSSRDFNPIYDAMQFDLGFPHAIRPFLVTLRSDVASPFVPEAKPVVRRKSDDKREEPPSAEPVPPIHIDFQGIASRIVGFPVEEGRYEQIVAAKGRVAYTRFPVRGNLTPSWFDQEDPSDGTLFAYDFDDQHQFPMAHDVSSVRIASDHRTLAYRSGDHLRLIDVLDRYGDYGERRHLPRDPGRRTGWVDLSRISTLVEPLDEWGQMYREAWRLQRDQFWDDRMTDVDWELVRERYARLVPLLRTRAELSDLIWEMQGELGTSHAYEMGGDYRKPPSYRRGFLGADLRWDAGARGYRIVRILRGDSWDREADSPLAAPGAGITEGDLIMSVGGHAVSESVSPDELLVNAAGKWVTLAIAPASDPAARRNVAVQTLKQERSLLYRSWVRANRDNVHARTNGRIGYIHIPDMGPWGYAEFHRGYLSEFDRDGLIVDVRFNRGGHVSPLLLEKLARKRVGYDVPRWGLPQPYPPESVRGPMVALTNQFAGSDGDIFSHCFKLYGLGPLVGKRTWGGVIGIWPRHALVDGTMTTQPEFSFWFTDVGWSVENYGTDPDYDIDTAPQDARAGRDPQMDKALELILAMLEKNPPKAPEFPKRPSLAIPAKLAKR
jgi:tricorn protease